MKQPAIKELFKIMANSFVSSEQKLWSTVISSLTETICDVILLNLTGNEIVFPPDLLSSAYDKYVCFCKISPVI